MQKVNQPKIPGEDTILKTILLVEDDSTIGEVLTLIISQETPYTGLLASDAIEALDLIQAIEPNLFILDYQLPHMNGIELYDRLHAIEALKHIPAIMISAQLPQKDLDKRHIIGMSKPFDLDELLQTIEASLV